MQGEYGISKNIFLSRTHSLYNFRLHLTSLKRNCRISYYENFQSVILNLKSISRLYVVYGEDFTHGFDTQNYPKVQASLGTQPENTHGIQRQTQPIPVDFFGSGPVIPMGTRLKFLPLGTMGTRLKFLPSGTRGPQKLATLVFILNPKLYYSRNIML
jgi:hypothetical protein